MHRPPCFVLCDSTKGPQRRDQKLSALGGQGQLGHFGISVWVLFSKMVPPLPRGRKWVSGVPIQRDLPVLTSWSPWFEAWPAA